MRCSFAATSPKARDQAARQAERHPIETFETEEDAKAKAPTFADNERQADNIRLHCAETMDTTLESTCIFPKDKQRTYL